MCIEWNSNNLASNALLHMFTRKQRAPPKSHHPWSAKYMCEHIIRDAHDKYLTQQQDNRSKSVLSAQTRNLRIWQNWPENNKSPFQHIFLSH